MLIDYEIIIYPPWPQKPDGPTTYRGEFKDREEFDRFAEKEKTYNRIVFNATVVKEKTES